MVDEVARIVESDSFLRIFRQFHTGDTKEADNPTDNNFIMCQDILINVIFGCESELWRHWFGECARPREVAASACETLASNMMLISTIVTVSQIKFTFKRLLNSLLYFIGLIVIRNEQQYLARFMFIKFLVFII